MEIQGPLTVEELREATILGTPKLLRSTVLSRSQNALNPSKWKFVAFAVVAGYMLAQIIRNPQATANGRWLPPLLIVSVIAYQIFLGPKVARRGYERRICRIQRVTSVDPDGLRFEDSEKAFQLRPWSAYQSWREGSLIFLLRGPQRVSNIIPKRGMTSEQVDALRVLLAMHMPDSA